MVSVIVDITNRQGFINKKIIEALTKQREKTLLQQKEEHENLTHSIFPPMVAKDLIRKQSGQDLTVSPSGRDFGLGHMNLSSLVAQMHQEVTILFTDIVGFTSMSQTVAPQQVMEFLHELLFSLMNWLAGICCFGRWRPLAMLSWLRVVLMG